MKTTIISIGNSKGVRIPKVLLEESELQDTVEIKAKKGEIKIVPIIKEKVTFDALAAASYNALAKDWLRPEEEDAWKIYQSEE